jgi:hypothetical protein
MNFQWLPNQSIARRKVPTSNAHGKDRALDSIAHAEASGVDHHADCGQLGGADPQRVGLERLEHANQLVLQLRMRHVRDQRIAGVKRSAAEVLERMAP